MYYELRCYTTAETVTIMNKTYSCAAGSYKLFYKLQGWFGIKIGSKIRICEDAVSGDAFVSLKNGSSNLCV